MSPANSRTYQRRPQCAAGFSLVEMLVAVAIFTAIMLVVSAMFTSSVATVKRGYQTIDAYQTARGIESVMERDLMAAFTARDSGDYYNFCGTPVGMSFITFRPDDRADGGPALVRVTYVIRLAEGEDAVAPVDIQYPPDSDDPEDYEANVYSLVRFEEPYVEDLDTYPYTWPEVDLEPVAEEEFSELPVGSIEGELKWAVWLAGQISPRNKALAQELVNAKKRELWIRMLAGEPGLPLVLPWDNDDDPYETDDRVYQEDARNYILAENIALVYTDSVVATVNDYYTAQSEQPVIARMPDSVPSGATRLEGLFLLSFDADRVSDESGSHGGLRLRPFFQYAADSGRPSEMLPYWNTVYNLLGGRLLTEGEFSDFINKHYHDLAQGAAPGALTLLGTPLQARLPELVRTDLTMLTASTYPGVPNLHQRFAYEIDLRAGYARRKTEFD